MVVALVIAAVLAVALTVAVEAAHRARDQVSRQREDIEHLRLKAAELEQRLAEATADPEPEAPRSLVDSAPVALTDTSSGLLNEDFFRVTLEARVSAARRHLRPVAVVLLQVAATSGTDPVTLTDPAVVGECIRVTLRDADTSCRLSDGRFALVLEDTPENGAVWTVERVRRALANDQPGQTLWAGIACYPAHAFDATELYDRAGAALASAREWHQDRIEVATADA